MFRISRLENRTRTLLAFDGHIEARHFSAAEDACTEALARGQRVHVFLAGLEPIDEICRTLLCRLANRGVRLHASRVSMPRLSRVLVRSGRCQIDSVYRYSREIPNFFMRDWSVVRRNPSRAAAPSAPETLPVEARSA